MPPQQIDGLLYPVNIIGYFSAQRPLRENGIIKLDHELGL